MNENELENKRREALNFQTAQHIVALLEYHDDNNVDSILKLTLEIRQSKEQRENAVILHQINTRSNFHSVKGNLL
jgi:hypothetical protein